MLKGAVTSFFIVLNKLPRHVSASKCHLHEVTLSFHKLLQFFSRRFRWVWTIVHWVRPSAAAKFDHKRSSNWPPLVHYTFFFVWLRHLHLRGQERENTETSTDGLHRGDSSVTIETRLRPE
jgi:hypothetical protein